jgi:hypothetical protein
VGDEAKGVPKHLELAAVLLEAGLIPKYALVCTEGTIPYARPLEDETPPNTARIMEATLRSLAE